LKCARHASSTEYDGFLRDRVAACLLTIAVHNLLAGPAAEPIAIAFVLPILIGAGVGGVGPGLLATALAEVALVALDTGTATAST